MTTTSLKKPVIKGLYAITPDEPDTAKLLNQVEQALRGGARILQYRNKSSAASVRLQQASALRELTRGFDTTFIVNDDAALAATVKADGVHLGGEDGGIAAARALLGKDRIIGASCYNRAPLAQEAVQQGADYVAFGAFFTSSIKPEAVKVDEQLLRSARSGLTVPIVAIGGITLQNGSLLVQAGADALAVISALWNAPDIAQAAREFNNLFDKA